MDFDEKAKIWDNDFRFRRAKKISEEIIKAIPKDLHKSALEFGCGTGLVSFNFKDVFKKITLVDLSIGMIEQLKEKISYNKIENMIALNLDINKESKPLGTYDVIYTSMALHHILDTKITLENLYKLLKPNGMLCIVDLDLEDGSFHQEDKDFCGHNGFLQTELSDILFEIGFKEVKSNTFYEDIKLVGDKEVKYTLFLMSGKK